jgi:hypothetical protein
MSASRSLVDAADLIVTCSGSAGSVAWRPRRQDGSQLFDRRLMPIGRRHAAAARNWSSKLQFRCTPRLVFGLFPALAHCLHLSEIACYGTNRDSDPA